VASEHYLMNTPLLVTASSNDAPYAVILKDQSHQWVADELQASGGGNTGPNPHQLLLSALGACTAITLRMYAARKSWPLSGIEVALEFNPSGTPPQGGSDIRRCIRLRGELTGEQRARLLEIANHCPIHKVLTGEVRIESSLT
jgi:putative redox protein